RRSRPDPPHLHSFPTRRSSDLISMAVNAMRDGAYDFMEKPFSPERLVEVARRALEQRGLAREVWSLRKQLAERDSLEGKIIGRSDRKSTRLNSSHVKISYADFC